MKLFTRLVLGLVLLAALMPAGVASARPQQQPLPVSCEAFASSESSLYIPGSIAISGQAPSGAETCVIMPSLADWNGGLVIFAHGYVFAYPPDKAVTIPWDQIILKDPDTGEITGTIPQLILGMKFAFATTSYSKNGLAVVEGVKGVLELVRVFKTTLATQLHVRIPPPEIPVFLVGASEGGLVTTLALEGYPKIFSGGLAACGPVGDFRKQVDYWGDLRVVYDHYFPSNQLGNNAMAIPAETMAGWGSLADPSLWGPVLSWNYGLISADLTNNTGLNTQRLLAATGAPVDPLNPLTIYGTILGILEYNVMATNEAVQELGGNPYSNLDTVYTTYPPDPTLNSGVQRISADKDALKAIRKKYQTKGLLKRPLVLLHTTGDPIVPFWHTALYSQKVIQNGTTQYLNVIPITRYGHCMFKPEEELLAFQTMLMMASMQAGSAKQAQ